MSDNKHYVALRTGMVVLATGVAYAEEAGTVAPSASVTPPAATN